MWTEHVSLEGKASIYFLVLVHYFESVFNLKIATLWVDTQGVVGRREGRMVEGRGLDG